MGDWTINLRDKTITRFSIQDGQSVSIGRGKECDVTIDNTAISRKHISIQLQNGLYFVSDLGSTNGTFVNGNRIDKKQPVSENDNISFSKFTLSPATEFQDENNVLSSASTAGMDMNEETIFVSTPKTQKPKTQQFIPKEKGPFLKALQGNATPEGLSLHGTNSVKIGKDSTCDIIITGWFVAKAQCYIIKRSKGYFIVPQKSWAATYVNDKKITEEHPLYQGDIIKIRSNIIRYD